MTIHKWRNFDQSLNRLTVAMTDWNDVIYVLSHVGPSSILVLRSLGSSHRYDRCPSRMYSLWLLAPGGRTGPEVSSPTGAVVRTETAARSRTGRPEGQGHSLRRYATAAILVKYFLCQQTRIFIDYYSCQYDIVVERIKQKSDIVGFRSHYMSICIFWSVSNFIILTCVSHCLPQSEFNWRSRKRRMLTEMLSSWRRKMWGGGAAVKRISVL